MILFKMAKLALETAEKVFGDGIIIRVALARHTLPDRIRFKAFAESLGGVLNASVAVKNKPFRRFLAAASHINSVDGELSVDAVGEGIADDFAGPKVFYDGEVQPALGSGNISDITDPRLVWAVKIEVPFEEIRCDGETVSRVGGSFVCPASRGINTGQSHLSVYPFS